ncbi:MAG: class I SAM-dependent methyltransferase [Chloroflexi bacterium]|nr:class I SAM-dependent methyltransferase [Chloroflexota bacterium]
MAVAQFTREYSTVRRAEGWGSHDSAYYRALPFADLTRRNEPIWRIRARSYTTLVEHVLAPMERQGSLTIVDLGAGNGWLANRLAGRGHSVVAVDLLADALDGLGAVTHYMVPVAAVVAEFDYLPLPSHAVDLAVFNASLHYSTDYARTLQETLRVLRPHATLVILDSPMYSDPTSGARMVQERQARFRETYGFASNALRSEHFLTSARLHELGDQLNLNWQLHQPALDWRSRIGRTFGGIRARREPAHFPVIVGSCR